MEISDEKRATQARWGRNGCLIAVVCTILIVLLFAIPSGSDEIGPAEGSIENLSVDGDRINVDGVVVPSDRDETVVPAIAQILEKLRERTEPAGANMTRLPIPVEQVIRVSITLRNSNGDEMDFGNLELPLMALYTAPSNNPIALLKLVNSVEAGTGPGIERGVEWCLATRNSETVPEFCSQVSAAAE